MGEGVDVGINFGPWLRRVRISGFIATLYGLCACVMVSTISGIGGIIDVYLFDLTNLFFTSSLSRCC